MKHITPSEIELSANERWLIVSRYLSTVFTRQFDLRSLSDQISRITNENGSPSLILRAVSDVFEKDLLFLDAGEVGARRATSPVVAWFEDGTPFILLGRTFSGNYKVSQIAGTGEFVETTIPKREFKKRLQGAVQFLDRVPLDVWEASSDLSDKTRWFWGSIRPLIKSLRHLILAAFVGNLLAVGVSLFALQVWDRVIPAQSINSLTVLMIGVGVAIVFEFALRLQRASLIDDVGKVVDRSISSSVFGHMLDMKSDARPASLGSMAAQVREINQIREAISSSMLNAAIDLPFVVLYIAVIYMIGGSLVFPIVAVIPIVFVIGLIAQFPLAKLAQEGLEEASLRNGLIVESVLKSDEIKLQQAETTMQLRWEKAVEVANTVSNKQRRWRNFLTNATQSLQQVAYIFVVALGANLVIAGDVTMGQVIACSILANRSIAPLTQVSAVMGALQGSIVAKRSIDELMQRPADTPTPQHLRRELSTPSFALHNLKYAYPNTEHGSLNIPKLDIEYGSKVGIIGRIGSGKSTLLRVLSGLAAPSEGTILLEGTEIESIHPSDLRKTVGFQSQGAALLRGTVRDNLTIAKPSATSDEMVAACEISGAMSLIKDNPRGLDLMINEAGEGLSGGQRQSLLLARTILRDPKVLLMDEPTASMDDQSEANFISSIQKWGADKTLIIATHRMKPLSICDRLIVIEGGRIALDGPKDDILARLNGGGQKNG